MRIHIQNHADNIGEPLTMTHWEEAVARAGARPHEVTVGHTMEDYTAAMQHAEALVTGTRGTRALFPVDAPKLKMVFCTSAGLDIVPFDKIQPGVQVMNNSGTHGPKAGEYGIMAILMLANGMPKLATAQQAGKWRRVTGSVLAGRTVTVLGLGSLGGGVAERASQFGLRVIGVRTKAEPHPFCERVVATADLDSVLPETEFLVITLPLTKNTQNIIDRRRLALLPNYAGVVNIGRGPLLDQDALCDMLEAGTLSGAVLDVFVPEPIPDGHRLWTTPNLVITPHVSCDDPITYNSRSFDIFLENVAAFEAGLPLPNHFLPERGY
ncbi:D-2-hydroxyacid dehydrogenase [Acidisphaera sp. L21]|uniref:D-2-hydroxyacid dehydrogenase n=1 Tax=Acidisphaera sp. L21 TaxID=1641851 RepID=UPI00131D21BB|nr:D-2-hydroxyacid dehydrogenase [Acidisphaera sp. L21]